MGALAKTVKAAANASMDFVDQFLAKPDADAAKQQALAHISQLVQGTREMPASLGAGGDMATMQKYLPSSADEGRQRAMTALKAIGGLGLGIGALSGLARHAGSAVNRSQQMADLEERPTMPNREVYVPLGRKAAGLGTTAAGIGGLAAYGPAMAGAVGWNPMKWLGDKARSAKQYGKELFTSTENPATHPMVWPIATALGVAGIYGGSKITGALLAGMRERRMQRELANAKTEFQDALSAQYDAAKSASAGTMKIHDAIDALSQAYASGELEAQSKTLAKDAGAELDPTDPHKPRGAHVGKGNMALGGYLSLMALLGMGGIAGGYAFAKGRDAPRREAQLLQRATRRRQLATPPHFIARYEGE